MAYAALIRVSTEYRFSQSLWREMLLTVTQGYIRSKLTKMHCDNRTFKGQSVKCRRIIFLVAVACISCDVLDLRVTFTEELKTLKIKTDINQSSCKPKQKLSLVYTALVFISFSIHNTGVSSVYMHFTHSAKMSVACMSAHVEVDAV